MSSSSNFCPNQNPNSRYLSSLLLHSLYSRGVSTFLVFFFANANSHLLRATLELYIWQSTTLKPTKKLYTMETKIGHQENDRSSSSLDMKTGGAVLLNYPLEKERESSIHHIFWERRVFNPCDPFMQFQVPSVPPCKIILLLTVVLFCILVLLSA